MSRLCRFCQIVLFQRDNEPKGNFLRRVFCNHKCRANYRIKYTTNLRALAIFELYKTGKYTLKEIGQLNGGISWQRVSQILQKSGLTRHEKYLEIVKLNKKKAIRKCHEFMKVNYI